MLSRRSGRRPPKFLPTPSARWATHSCVFVASFLNISTHALREEGDARTGQIDVALAQFLPTPSARRATLSIIQMAPSPHNFYPRPPRGGRQQMCHKTKAIFWQHLYNEIQLTKKAGCICAGCTVFEAQPACLSKTDRCEAAGDFLSAVPSHQSSAFGDSIP